MQQGLKTTSYLLEKLLTIYNLNTLIINLYPGNKGYSLSLTVNGNSQHLYPPDGHVSLLPILIPVRRLNSTRSNIGSVLLSQ